MHASGWPAWFGWAETKPLLVAGPCVVESYDICAQVAEKLVQITDRLGFFYVFKASYRKANRTRITGFQGIGDAEALEILARVKRDFGVPVLTDVHETPEVPAVAEVADVVQVPAFLARQTALLLAVGQTGRIVNIKKGQFMSAQAALFAAEKVASTGNTRIFLTERGTFFGYEDLVVDFRNIPRLREGGYPVLMDATHAVQKPNTAAGVTLGERAFVELYARLGVVAGAEGVFLEVHPVPEASPSDAATMLPLDRVEPLLTQLAQLYSLR